jgi:hypothetical protein
VEYIKIWQNGSNGTKGIYIIKVNILVIIKLKLMKYIKRFNENFNKI